MHIRCMGFLHVLRNLCASCTKEWFYTRCWGQAMRLTPTLIYRTVSYPIYPSALLELLRADLEGIELVVAALQMKKLLMGALLHDLAVGQQDDVVRVLDGA